MLRKGRAHTITPSESAAQPTTLVALAVEARAVSSAVDPCSQVEVLERWATAGWTASRGGGYREWQSEGEQPDWFWRAFAWGTKRPGLVWVVAYDMVRALSLLGAWTRIQQREVVFDGRREKQGSRGVQGDPVPQVPGASTVRPGRGRGDKRPVPGLRGDDDCGLRGDDREACSQEGGGVGYCAIDDPPTVLTLRVPGRPGRIRFVDARNYGMASPVVRASASAQSVNLRAIIRRMVDHLARSGWGGLACTAASQSLRIWRCRYMTDPPTVHDDAEASALERAAYVGGRCECGRIGDLPGPVYHVDMRSAYGWASANVLVPQSLQDKGRGQVSLLRASRQEGRDCIAEVCLDTGQADYPSRSPEGVIYGVGRVRTVLAGPELCDALAADRVRAVGAWCRYSLAPCLRDYARDLWRFRLDCERRHDVALAQWAKALIVGLPGKMGQRDMSWRDRTGIPPPAPWCAWWTARPGEPWQRLRSLAGQVQAQERGDWSYDAVPAIACWIHSAVRLRLIETMWVAGRSECYYWDTDSLILSETGYERLTHRADLWGGNMGQWRLIARAQVASVCGHKHYVMDGVRTCAGRPRETQCESTAIDRYWYRTTFGQALVAREPPRAGRVLKHYRREERYRLGRVGPDGIVLPHVMEDW